MNTKHYLGKTVTSFEQYAETGPVTGITLIKDDMTEIFSGSESGYVLTIDCPYATQAMADNILSAVENNTYKGYKAAGASLDIGAELGDGVTVNGIYSVLAYQSLVFGPGHTSEISAPGENVVNHEFPYLSPAKREAKRSRTSMWSAIEKNAANITLEVGKITSELENYATIEMTDASIELAVSESKIYTDGKIETLGTTVTTDINGVKTQIKGLDGEITTISETLDGLTVTDSDGTTKISGSSIETDTLYVKSANITGELTAQKLSGDKVNIVSSTGTIYGEMSVSSSGALYILSGVASGFLLGGTDAKPTVACLGTFYAENYEERIYTLERLMGLA